LLQRLCVGPDGADKRNKQNLWRAARHAQDQTGEAQALAGISGRRRPSRSRFRQVKKPHADAARPSNGNQEPQFRGAGLALAAITP
jgi:hypothetical protein